MGTDKIATDKAVKVLPFLATLATLASWQFNPVFFKSALICEICG